MVTALGEGRTMSMTQRPEPIREGTYVNVLNSQLGKGRVVEYRGALGPKGERVYRIQVGSKRVHLFMEVREDQLEVLPSGPNAGQPSQQAPLQDGKDD